MSPLIASNAAAACASDNPCNPVKTVCKSPLSNGRAASMSVSSATVTISTPAGASSSCSACHPGRSKRQPHHDAQAMSTTLRPRCARQVERVAVEIAQHQVGHAARSSTRRSPRSRSQRPEAVRLRRGRPASRAARPPPSRRSARRRRVLSGGSGTQTSSRHAPSGLISQPVICANSSSVRSRRSSSTAKRYRRQAALRSTRGSISACSGSMCATQGASGRHDRHRDQPGEDDWRTPPRRHRSPEWSATTPAMITGTLIAEVAQREVGRRDTPPRASGAMRWIVAIAFICDHAGTRAGDDRADDRDGERVHQRGRGHERHPARPRRPTRSASPWRCVTTQGQLGRAVRHDRRAPRTSRPRRAG